MIVSNHLNSSQQTIERQGAKSLFGTAALQETFPLIIRAKTQDRICSKPGPENVFMYKTMWVFKIVRHISGGGRWGSSCARNCIIQFLGCGCISFCWYSTKNNGVYESLCFPNLEWKFSPLLLQLTTGWRGDWSHRPC